MDNAILMPFLGSLFGGMITAAVAYFTLRRDRQKQERDFAEQRAAQERQFAQERAKQEREFAERLATTAAATAQERDTLRNAVQAELQRVEAVVARQRKHVWDDDKNAVRSGFERDPLNWAPIHTPIWDAVVAQGKVGLLPADDAQLWSWFFGYVRWMNNDLFALYKFYKDESRLADFGHSIATAYQTLLDGQWRPQRIAPPSHADEREPDPTSEKKLLGPKKEKE